MYLFTCTWLSWATSVTFKPTAENTSKYIYGVTLPLAHTCGSTLLVHSTSHIWAVVCSGLDIVQIPATLHVLKEPYASLDHYCFIVHTWELCGMRWSWSRGEHSHHPLCAQHNFCFKEGQLAYLSIGVVFRFGFNNSYGLLHGTFCCVFSTTL